MGIGILEVNQILNPYFNDAGTVVVAAPAMFII